MPLVKRTVEPVHVSRGAAIASGVSLVRDELEYVNVATLANVVRQLGSLSCHVDDLFDELSREAGAITRRMIALADRTERLKVKITQLNPTVEEVLLQDINMRKPFKSSVIKDQQVISLATRPFAITEIYRRCEPPPPLQKLNPYRQDGKDSLKFYTEPGYFFELWCQAMQKDAARNQQKRHKRPRRSPYLPQTAEEDEKTIKDLQKVHPPNTSLPTDSAMMACQGHNCVGEIQHTDGIVQLRSASVNGRSHSRPSSLELQNSGGNVLPSSMPMQPVAPANHAPALPVRSTSNTPSVASADCIPADIKTITPSANGQTTVVAEDRKPANEELSYATDTCKESPQKPVSLPNGGMEITAVLTVTAKTDSTSTTNFGVVLPSLPSPPPTPPAAKSKPIDAGPVVLPSPARSCKSESRDGTKNSTPDSVDLPPPPSPPPQFCQSSLDSPGGVLPPPPLDDSFDAIPPRVSPPPPMSPPPTVLAADDKTNSFSSEMTSSLQGPVSVIDGLSIASDVSSATVSSGSTAKSEGTLSALGSGEPPLIRDNRSDLLAAIREGIQLRKVEERRLKTAQKHRPTGHLDVQSLMEAAFELRRKALEENDSEEDDAEEPDELSGNWSDVD